MYVSKGLNKIVAILADVIQIHFHAARNRRKHDISILGEVFFSVPNGEHLNKTIDNVSVWHRIGDKTILNHGCPSSMTSFRRPSNWYGGLECYKCQFINLSAFYQRLISAELKVVLGHTVNACIYFPLPVISCRHTLKCKCAIELEIEAPGH